MPSDSAFCGGCGKPVQDATLRGVRPNAYILLLAGLFASGIIAAAIVIVNRSGDAAAAAPTETHGGLVGALPTVQRPPAPPPPVRKHHSLPLYSGVVSVPARNLTWKCFSVLSQQEDPKVVGRFQAVGGSGNDIQMVIASEDEFTTWRTIHSGTLLYDSGKMTATGVDVAIPAQGKYCAAFSNGFSALSAKAVTATINVEFSTWETPRY
jgi:hypothetical protein